MKQVLVTGSGGQLGLCIQKIAGNYPEIKFHFKTKDTLDITSEDEIRAVFKSGNFDYCINCASYTKVDLAEQETDQAFLINATAVKNLALAAKETTTTLIHISTDYVFDGKKKEGYYPSDPPNPINAYGRSKLQGEEHIKEILVDYLIIRTSWLYSEYGNNFYKTILKKASEGETLYITDAQLGCPTNANHLAKYIMGFITAKEKNSGIYHFTDGEKMTWYDFAKKIVQGHDLTDLVEIKRAKDYKSVAPRPEISVLLP